MKEYFYSAIHYLKVDWVQYLIDVSAALLIFLVAATMLYQIYEIHSLLVDQGRHRAVFNKKPATEKVHKTNLTLKSWHLFGFKDKNSLATFHQKWTLRGVILAKDMKNNLAIISSSDTDEEIYKAGDLLPDGTLIVDIYFNRAILSTQGRNQTLLLWEKQETTGQSAADLAHNKSKED